MSKKSLYIVLVLVLNAGLLLVFSAPFSSDAKSDEIFVDADASGKQDGSSDNPYKTISKALKKAEKGDKIFVAEGEYEENIKIEKGVKVFGSDKDDVIIEADHDDEPVVKMEDDTELNEVTVKKGKVGIEVKEDAGDVSIIKVKIKDNDKDGINVKKGKVSDEEKVNIVECDIENNGWSGIYSEKRRIIIMENSIKDNGKDGIDLAAGSKAWIYKNDVRENDGVGMKFVLDGSNIWTKRNEMRKNDKSGIEVKTFGTSGTVNVAKSKIVGNEAYGVVKNQQGYQPSSIWKGLAIDAETNFTENVLGNISRVTRI